MVWYNLGRMPIKIMFIDKSVSNCKYVERLFSLYENVLFYYENEYNKIKNICFDFYDICFYVLNHDYSVDFLHETRNTIFVACDNDYNEDDDYIKEIMNSGFDLYTSSVMNYDNITHIMNIYKINTLITFI